MLLGTTLLFINWGILKYILYSPAATDAAGFFLSILMLYFYLNNFSLGEIIIALLGSFVWPTLFITGVLLFLFPKKIIKKQKTEITPKAVTYIFIAVFSIFFIKFCFSDKITNAGSGTFQKLNPLLAIFSYPVAVVYIFSITKEILLKRLVINQKFIIRILVIVALYTIIHFFIKNFSSGQGFSAGDLIQTTIVRSVLKPGIFLVSHFAFFGPSIIFAVIFRKKLFHVVSNYGNGVILLFLLNLFIALNSESRLLIAFYPFFIYFLTLILSKIKLTKAHLIAVVAVSFLISRFYIKIGGNLDLYFMNFGPWMSGKWYVLFSVLFITGIFLINKFTSKQIK